MPIHGKMQKLHENKQKSNDDTTDQQAGSSDGKAGRRGRGPKSASGDKHNKNANTKASGSHKPIKVQSTHLEEDCFGNTSHSSYCPIVAKKCLRHPKVKNVCSGPLNEQKSQKKVKKIKFNPDDPNLDLQHFFEIQEIPLIVDEIIQTALENTSDAIAESIVNDAIECAYQNTSEGIARGIINGIIDEIPDEIIIYSAEYWDSGRLSQVSIDNSIVKRRSYLPYMPLTSRANFKKMFKQLFLPHGFPETVSADYAEYQLWDSLQAFFSTLTGALTTHSVMKGFGVGNAEATAASAAMTWMLKDGAGLIGRIGFAYWKGRQFDMDCKKWRFFADILNDSAMLCECLIPVLTPTRPFFLLCLSTSMKSLVGVAGGATRAALTQHQAIAGNMADVSAKDQSQECCVNLIASLIGIFLLMTVADSRYKWQLFLFFVFCHIMFNYRAVRSVRLATLNTARFVLLLRCYFLLKVVGSVKRINEKESVFVGRGFGVADLCGYDVRLGVSIPYVKITERKFVQLSQCYKKYHYILYVDNAEHTIQVFLKKNATSVDLIQAFFHAIILAIATHIYYDEYLMIVSKQYLRIRRTVIDQLVHIICDPNNPRATANTVVSAAAEVVENNFPDFLTKLKNRGWDLEHLMFEDGGCRGNP